MMKQIIFIIIVTIAMLQTNCTPITPLTRVKKTPKVYTQNFCCDQKIKRYLGKKTPWIVYSQSGENPTFYNPGGKVVLKKAAYMEAFLVIGSKGDYLRLIKYAPDIIENNSLKNRKKIEYCGWMHRNKLLLSSHALTDIASGRTYKMITMIKNINPLSESEKFFAKDSLILYKEPELLNPVKKIALHSLTYLYKKSQDRSKSLVFAKSQISPETAQKIVSGWTSSSFITPYGTSYYSDLAQMPLEKIILNDKYGRAIEKDSSIVFQAEEGLARLNPISALKTNEQSVEIGTYLSVPMIDNNDNYIYGLSGKSIRYGQFKKLKNDLKYINIVFAFENQQSIVANFEQLVVSVGQFKNKLSRTKNVIYRIGAVVGFAGGFDTLLEIPLSQDIDKVVRELEKLADNKKNIVLYKSQSWDAVRSGLRLLQNYKNQNNLMVIFGESGNNNEQTDTNLIENVTACNARILGCQFYSDSGNTFNNFVLQTQDIISRSSKEIVEKKKDFLVNSRQLQTENLFVQQSENAYRLDFPKQSSWQGRIIFPKKKEQLPQDLFVSSAISLVDEILMDVQNIKEELQKSFSDSGMPRTKINSEWAALQNLPDRYAPNVGFAKPLAGTEPYTLFPAWVQTERNNWTKGNHFLLLSEEEVEKVQTFLEDITKEQVDYKYSSKKTPKTLKKSLIEDDGVLSEQEKNEPYRYLNTHKVRKSILKSYYKWNRYNKLYPPKKHYIRELSLSQAQTAAVYFPSINDNLNQLKVKDLTNKRKLSDSDLDKLVEYFLQKKEEFGKQISPQNQLNVNGEIFYKISAMYLP